MLQSTYGLTSKLVTRAIFICIASSKMYTTAGKVVYELLTINDVQIIFLLISLISTPRNVLTS
jgi:hypothetical protein